MLLFNITVIFNLTLWVISNGIRDGKGENEGIIRITIDLESERKRKVPLMLIICYINSKTE